MEMAYWKNLIQKQGGMEFVSQFICDNSRYHYMTPGIPVTEQVELDETNDAWIFHKKEQAITINGKKIVTHVVEANESLQAILFADKLEEKKYIRRDI